MKIATGTGWTKVGEKTLCMYKVTFVSERGVSDLSNKSKRYQICGGRLMQKMSEFKLGRFSLGKNPNIQSEEAIKAFKNNQIICLILYRNARKEAGLCYDLVGTNVWFGLNTVEGCFQIAKLLFKHQHSLCPKWWWWSVVIAQLWLSLFLQVCQSPRVPVASAGYFYGRKDSAYGGKVTSTALYEMYPSYIFGPLFFTVHTETTSEPMG